MRRWSAFESIRSSRFDWSPTKSSMLWPCRSASTFASTSLALPCTKSFWKSLRGLFSAGIGAPLRVKLSVRPPSLVMHRGIDEYRVATPTCSAASWSSDTQLRNPPRSGCGVPVRKHFSAAWPPVTPGRLTPENTVMFFRCAASFSRYGVSA